MIITMPFGSLLSDPTRSIVVICVNIFQNELMVEIYFKGLVGAFGKVFLMKSRTPIKIHKGNENWPLFENGQLFWWSTSITLDNDDFLT